MLLGLAFGVGFLLLLVPGLLVLMAFGWVPLRILLRGESLAQAARGSFQMMGRTWRRALLTVSALYIGPRSRALRNARRASQGASPREAANL